MFNNKNENIIDPSEMLQFRQKCDPILDYFFDNLNNNNKCIRNIVDNEDEVVLILRGKLAIKYSNREAFAKAILTYAGCYCETYDPIERMTYVSDIFKFNEEVITQGVSDYVKNIKDKLAVANYEIIDSSNYINNDVSEYILFASDSMFDTGKSESDLTSNIFTFNTMRGDIKKYDKDNVLTTLFVLSFNKFTEVFSDDYIMNFQKSLNTGNIIILPAVIRKKAMEILIYETQTVGDIISDILLVYSICKALYIILDEHGELSNSVMKEYEQMKNTPFIEWQDYIVNDMLTDH